MYVVRIENDEALMFRAFGKWTDAKAWATTSAFSGEVDQAIEVYSVPECFDPMEAVESVRDGKAMLVTTGEKLMLENFREVSSFLAGIGMGTGAGF